MGKALQSLTKLRELTRVVHPTESPNQNASETPTPKSVNEKIKPKLSKQIKMDGSEEQSRNPLAHEGSDCVKRWFMDALSEAWDGDASMELLVGQMYNSGYGVQKNSAK